MQKMISSSTLTLSNLVPNQAPMPETKQNPTTPTIPTDQQHPDSARATRKLRGSSQLNLWSRARAIRSGRKLERPSSVQTRSRDMAESSRSPVRSPDYSSEEERDSERIYYPGFGEGEEKRAWSSHEEDMAVGKSIYMVSDGSGWTAEHSVNAALGQFEHCLVDRGCPVNTHLFSGIDDAERLMEIVQQAAKEGAMLVYTLADENMAASARQACKLWGVPATDILSPITEAIGSHLGVSPSGLPRGAPGRKNALTDEYFKRIEAVEFTIKQDDGALPQNLHKSDIVLAGVSRTGKTPLSIYLAQKGYKVANVPIVMGLELPKTLFEIDPEKVFALTINPLVLQTIRKERAKSLGFGDEVRSSYAEMVCVKEELEYAHKIFTQNPVWPVIEVTGKAIEETAVVILRLYQDRKSRCSMPRISKRY